MRTTSLALTAAIAPPAAVVAWMPMRSTPAPAASNPLRVRGGDSDLQRQRDSRRRRKTSTVRLQDDDSCEQENGDQEEGDFRLEELDSQRAQLEMLLRRQRLDLFDSAEWSTSSKSVTEEEWALFQQFVEEDEDSYYDGDDDDNYYDLSCDGDSSFTFEGVAVGCTTEDCEQCDIPEEFKVSDMKSVDVMAFLGIQRAAPIQTAARRSRLRFYEDEDDEDDGEWN